MTTESKELAFMPPREKAMAVFTEDQVKAAITVMAKGLVRNVKINY